MTLSFANPSSVHAPLGLYSHTVSVPEGTELLFISGQLGVRADGTTPPTMAEQAEQVFSNIIALLRAHELGPTDIVKLTTFMVAGQDSDAVRAASSTVSVSALLDPAWVVEVEAIAAKRSGIHDSAT